MQRRQFLAGIRTTSLATLASRVLGLVRDMAMAALFGLTGGGVMDAFVVAFRIPNLARRLFGEGALAASYLPVFSERLERGRTGAWQLASVTFTWLAIALTALTLLAEGLLALIAWWSGDDPQLRLVLGLTATMMPYMLLICLTAQLSATLHALGHFTWPALAPVLLNVCWLFGVWVVAPRFAPDKQAQAYAIAVCVLVAGVAQLAAQWPPLLRRGFRFDYDWQASRAAVGQVVRAMLPMMFGLAVTQVNTLFDSLIAWGLAATPESGPTIAWLGDVRYPLEQGAAAAVYYGERLYHFPLGVLGIAVATVIFPLLSRHAARGDFDRVGADLTHGLRLVLLIALPASAGLVLLAGPLARLLFERGEFTPEDTERTARMIAWYAAGVWAYCGLPVLIRGYYAVGDRLTPVKLGAAMVGLNLALNLWLIWPIGETALAITTSLSAALQLLLLAWVFSRRDSPLDWGRLARTAGVALVGCLLMATGCVVAARLLPDGAGLAPRLAEVAVPLAVGAVVYFIYLRLAAADELALLHAPPADSEDGPPHGR